MRVEQEWRNDKGHDGEPEVDHIPGPDGQCREEQDDDRSDTQIDGGSCESGVEDAEGDSSRCKSSTGGDVSSTTKVQVAQNGVSVDLGREDFEDRRGRQEMFTKTQQGSTCTSFTQFYGKTE